MKLAEFLKRKKLFSSSMDQKDIFFQDEKVVKNLKKKIIYDLHIYI